MITINLYQNLINFNKFKKGVVILNKLVKEIINTIRLNIFSLKQIKVTYK